MDFAKCLRNLFSFSFGKKSADSANKMTRFRVNSVEYPRNRLRFEYSCLSNIGPACHCTKRVRYNVSFPCNVTTEGHISPNKSGRCTERIRCSLNYNGLLIFLDLFDPISPDAAHCPGRRGLSRTACSSADSRFVNRSLVHHLDNMRIVRRTTGRRRIVAYPRTGKNVSASSIRSIETVPRRKVDRTITVGSWGGGRKTRRSSPSFLSLAFFLRVRTLSFLSRPRSSSPPLSGNAHFDLRSNEMKVRLTATIHAIRVSTPRSL